MNYEFPSYFQRMLEDSRSECLQNHRNHNREYRKTQEAYCQSMEEILKKLGPDGSLLYNMEKLLGTLRGMEENWITRQAVCDCMLCPALYGCVFPVRPGDGSGYLI